MFDVSKRYAPVESDRCELPVESEASRWFHHAMTLNRGAEYMSRPYALAAPRICTRPMPVTKTSFATLAKLPSPVMTCPFGA